MQPRSNPVARQLSSMPQTHRASTLQAIAQKAHANNARIEFLKVEGQRVNDLLKHMPSDASSRLAWVNQQLNID